MNLHIKVALDGVMMKNTIKFINILNVINYLIVFFYSLIN